MLRQWVERLVSVEKVVSLQRIVDYFAKDDG
jgi:hypothetical protein